MVACLVFLWYTEHEAIKSEYNLSGMRSKAVASFLATSASKRKQLVLGPCPDLKLRDVFPHFEEVTQTQSLSLWLPNVVFIDTQAVPGQPLQTYKHLRVLESYFQNYEFGCSRLGFPAMVCARNSNVLGVLL